MVSGAQEICLEVDISSVLNAVISSTPGRTQWQRSALSPLLREGLSPDLCLSLSHSHLSPFRHTKYMISCTMPGYAFLIFDCIYIVM
jgi:hypothetical protein